MDYDVVIVGSGPAGASTAYWLGEAGRQVLVLEKERLPRYKPCGGAIPRAVFERFPFDLSPTVERWIEDVHFRFRDGREGEAALPDRPVAMVMRDRFDLHLLRHTQADVQDGSAVVNLHQDEAGVEVITEAGETFRARYVIGADGAKSRVAQLVGLRQDRRVGAAIELEVAVDDGTLRTYANTALFVFGTPSNGYVWVFPKAEHLSVGIGAFQGRVSGMQQKLRREASQWGIHLDGTRPRGHALPFYLRHEPLHRGRVLLVGDAAGLVDPLLGEGIRHAIDSGRLAAEAILMDDVSGYTPRVQREIGDDLLWGRWWARVFYRFPRASFELAVRNPLFVEAFARLFAGEATYRQMTAQALPNILRGLGRRLPVDNR